ncbi:FliH/SctL family protein [Bradyrhizobium sp. LHD-71]|uniref:FliH/SctL family protein n=1 Tax=Bradyrhizobium sp. LHD-71 TaxID=3072141 RepID=UPI00280D80BE|nr:FliH/SctL family protein [Bradyrhizobium sp. LHD-71]MDQ8728138.1 FliH/SctL family protein [Bradyrhizobium sp. LHD-71]
MGAPAKFLFDQDFSSTARGDNANAAELARKLAEAEARGARAGYAAGQADAAAEIVRRNAAAIESIARTLGAIATRLQTAEARIEIEAVDIAVAVARKLCNELTSREPLAELTALVTDCLRQLVSTPHLVVRINDALYDDARIRIEGLAKQSGFEGRLVILSDPDVANGDCRLEWADGGISSDRNTTETKIAELVGRYMASRKAKETAA